MKRRFIDTDSWQAIRKLDSRLIQLYFYAWSKADSAGVYTIEWDYLKLDLKAKYTEHDFLKIGMQKIAGEKFLFENFIKVNYGELRENYNPHKPAFRDLAKNGLSLNEGMFKLAFKLEKEEEYEYEEEDEDVLGKSENPFVKNSKKEKQKIPPAAPLHELQLFVSQNYPNVCKLSSQLTAVDCEKLLTKYSRDKIIEKLMGMENLPTLTKKYKSVYLTIDSWFRLENKKEHAPNKQTQRDEQFANAAREATELLFRPTDGQ